MTCCSTLPPRNNWELFGFSAPSPPQRPQEKRKLLNGSSGLFGENWPDQYWCSPNSGLGLHEQVNLGPRFHILACVHKYVCIQTWPSSTSVFCQVIGKWNFGLHRLQTLLKSLVPMHHPRYWAWWVATCVSNWVFDFDYNWFVDESP